MPKGSQKHTRLRLARHRGWSRSSALENGLTRIELQLAFCFPTGAMAFQAMLCEHRPDFTLEKFDPLRVRLAGKERSLSRKAHHKNQCTAAHDPLHLFEHFKMRPNSISLAN